VLDAKVPFGGAAPANVDLFFAEHGRPSGTENPPFRGQMDMIARMGGDWDGWLTRFARGRLMRGEVTMVVYEQQLSRNLDWALKEGSMHFEKENAVHKTLRKLAKRLDELGIPYAFVGGMALFYHGVRRFTEDVDLLVTRESLKEIHDKLE